MSQEPSLDIGWGMAEEDLLFSELDGIIESFHDTITPDQKPDADIETSPALSSDADMFLWEDLKLSDTEQLIGFVGDGVKDEPESPKPLDSPYEAIPEPVTFDEIDDVADRKVSTATALLNSYGMNDEQLSDIGLKKLRSLCKTDSDYDDLKAYRRTCQNRYYARSSRSKQQVKTTSLARKLDESAQEIARLQKENEMKDATIRCLQLELQILRSITPGSK